MIFNLRQCAIATFMLLAAVTEADDNPQFPTLAPSDPPTFKPTNRPTFKNVEITIQKGKGKGKFNTFLIISLTFNLNAYILLSQSCRWQTNH
mmetsp:Transcript_30049/g.30408  ORF Transcript_30049/g.30408 Transcript_30049/m.30408 type:complete len:92 (+) Transcript_30049:69-344(+)